MMTEVVAEKEGEEDVAAAGKHPHSRYRFRLTSGGRAGKRAGKWNRRNFNPIPHKHSNPIIKRIGGKQKTPWKLQTWTDAFDSGTYSAALPSLVMVPLPLRHSSCCGWTGTVSWRLVGRPLEQK